MDPCVWNKTGAILEFNETSVGELSTINSMSGLDSHAGARQSVRMYNVESVSLNDLLATHSAPELMDYLSIDTEGSEFEILAELDWRRYKFRVITCEHNFTEKREQIYQLLASQGYTRVHEDISKWDDWYVLNE